MVPRHDGNRVGKVTPPGPKKRAAANGARPSRCNGFQPRETIKAEACMVSITFAKTYPATPGEGVTVVPLDVGHWAVITGPEPERHRVANALRLHARLRVPRGEAA